MDTEPSPSYRQADCCSTTDCNYLSTPNQPCWGQVECVEDYFENDDHYWVHACEGHRGGTKYCDYGGYTPEPGNHGLEVE